MSNELSQELISVLNLALNRIASGEPHLHHRMCKHNLSAERQKELDGFTEKERRLFKISEPVVITPDDWEVWIPDLNRDTSGSGE